MLACSFDTSTSILAHARLGNALRGCQIISLSLMYTFPFFIFLTSLALVQGNINHSKMFNGFKSKIIQVAKTETLRNSVVGFTLFGGSDVLAQKIEGQKRGCNSSRRLDRKFIDVDEKRAFISGTLGIVAAGYIYPCAYKQLDKIFIGKELVTLVKKSIVEICTVGVLVNSLSIAARGLLSGHSTQEVGKHVRDEMPQVFLNDARVWFPYNMVAFSILPVHMRPITTAIMESCWQTYISLCSNNYDEICQIEQTF